MPIAPITGKVRKQLVREICTALGLGTAGAYAYWYGVRLPAEHVRNEFRLKLEKQKAAGVAAE